MSEGYITVFVYAADQLIPIEGAGVYITQNAGKGPDENGDFTPPSGEKRENLIAYRTTDSSGHIGTITIPAPAEEESLEPEIARPYTSVDVRVSHPNFQSLFIHGAQIFSGVVSEQNVKMVPLSEQDTSYSQTEDVFVNSQNL